MPKVMMWNPPEAPPAALIDACAKALKAGQLVGMATESCYFAVADPANKSGLAKLDASDPLVNRLMLFDSLSMEFREVRIPRDPNCPLCGDNPTIHELIDYEAFCGAPVTTLG